MRILQMPLASGMEQALLVVNSVKLHLTALKIFSKVGNSQNIMHMQITDSFVNFQWQQPQQQNLTTMSLFYL